MTVDYGSLPLRGVVRGVRGEVTWEVEVLPENVLDGYIEVPCPDCDGAGEFEEPDGTTIRCGWCKGRRTILAMC